MKELRRAGSLLDDDAGEVDNGDMKEKRCSPSANGECEAQHGHEGQ